MYIKYEAQFYLNLWLCFRIVHVKAYSFQGFPVLYNLMTFAGSKQQNFAINPSTGVVDLLRKLDYETDLNQYHLKVKAVETGQVPRTSTVNVSVSDVVSYNL